MSNLKVFEKKNYINIESFRKNGEGVRTPVWFIEEGEHLFVVTSGKSGKVKRIRHNSKVNIATCTMRGTPTSPWQPAIAKEVSDSEITPHVSLLMDKKYGFLRKLVGQTSKRREESNTILEIVFQ